MIRFIKATIALLALVAAVLVVVKFGASHMLDMWEAEDCWGLDRQNSNGYPVAVPDWCEPHGFEPRPAPRN